MMADEKNIDTNRSNIGAANDWSKASPHCLQVAHLRTGRRRVAATQRPAAATTWCAVIAAWTSCAASDSPLPCGAQETELRGSNKQTSRSRQRAGDETAPPTTSLPRPAIKFAALQDEKRRGAASKARSERASRGWRPS